MLNQVGETNENLLVQDSLPNERKNESKEKVNRQSQFHASVRLIPNSEAKDNEEKRQGQQTKGKHLFVFVLYKEEKVLPSKPVFF